MCRNYKEQGLSRELPHQDAGYVMNGQVAQFRDEDSMCIVSCGGLLLKLPQSSIGIDIKKTLQVALSRG